MERTCFIAGRDFGDVLCNGVPLNDVVEVDIRHGYAIVGERGEDGNILIDGDEFKTKRVTGEMQFIPRCREN